MGGQPRQSQRFTFADAVDVPATLETCHIQFLDINPSRAIVIYSDAIFDLDSGETPLSAATTVEITMFEPPDDVDSADRETLAALIEDLSDRLASVSGTTATRQE